MYRCSFFHPSVCLVPYYLLSILFISSSAYGELNLDCNVINETAYFGVNQSQPIEVVRINGQLVSKQLTPAFVAMYRAAQGDGVTLELVSGFRTMAQQEHLYQCYINRNGQQCPSGCSSCNVAAEPGTSNHQNGTAIDIETNNGTNQAYQWLRAHAYNYGFNDTYNPPEPWHWVYQNPSIYPDPCGPGGLVEYSPTCASVDAVGAEDLLFKDVPDSLTGSDAVQLVFEAGITQGCSERHFCPNCLTTRAMMVTFVMRALGTASDAYSTSRFSDVPVGSYYLPFVEAAAAMGIINGCSPTTFCPEELVTRAQAAKILINAIGAPLDPPDTPTFTDIMPDHWSFPFIEALNTHCITTGCAPNRFCPNDHIPRIHAALFIARAFDLQNYNGCINHCDTEQCEATSFCESWSECTADMTCEPTGTQQRICHIYRCVGSEMNATCESTNQTEAMSCEYTLPAECETTAGETTAGETTAGETPAGETPAGETNAGETNAGETNAGETNAGETNAGETNAGRNGSVYVMNQGSNIEAGSSCYTINAQASSLLFLLILFPLWREKRRLESCDH
jgi:hypothetical protein